MMHPSGFGVHFPYSGYTPPSYPPCLGFPAYHNVPTITPALSPPSDDIPTNLAYSMLTYRGRLSTFPSWTINKPTPQELARAGFYLSDSHLICFRCRATIPIHAILNQDAWIAHSNVRPKDGCSYLDEKSSNLTLDVHCTASDTAGVAEELEKLSKKVEEPGKEQNSKAPWEQWLYWQKLDDSLRNLYDLNPHVFRDRPDYATLIFSQRTKVEELKTKASQSLQTIVSECQTSLQSFSVLRSKPEDFNKNLEALANKYPFLTDVAYLLPETPFTQIQTLFRSLKSTSQPTPSPSSPFSSYITAIPLRPTPGLAPPRPPLSPGLQPPTALVYPSSAFLSPSQDLPSTLPPTAIHQDEALSETDIHEYRASGGYIGVDGGKITPPHDEQEEEQEEEKDYHYREIFAHELDMEEKIGSGAFGVVYRGTYRGATVAIKQLHHFDVWDTKMLTEFRREASLMALCCNHPNVIGFVGACTTTENVCLVSEFAEQGSLEKLLLSGTELSHQVLVKMMIEGAAGVLHLHCEGVIHRDLAARNILVGKNYTVFITDFGFARAKQCGMECGKTQTSVGPVKYMAPESMRERVYSEKSDVFSFGVVLWEMLSRKEPWEKVDLLQVAMRVIGGEIGSAWRVPKGIGGVDAELLGGRSGKATFDERYL